MAYEPFTTVEEVQARLDWEMSEDEQRNCENAIEDASDLARHYGRNWEDGFTAPRAVKTLTRRAVVRYMRNPDHYVQSRAGDETVIWSDDGSRGGSPEFTEDEQKMLAELAGNVGNFGTVEVSHVGPMRHREREGYVPTVNGGKRFPFFSSDSSPW